MMLDLPQAWKAKQRLRIQKGGITPANRPGMKVGKILSGSLQGVKDPLAE